MIRKESSSTVLYRSFLCLCWSISSSPFLFFSSSSFLLSSFHLLYFSLYPISNHHLSLCNQLTSSTTLVQGLFYSSLKPTLSLGPDCLDCFFLQRRAAFILVHCYIVVIVRSTYRLQYRLQTTDDRQSFRTTITPVIVTWGHYQITLSTKCAKAFCRHHRSLSDQFKFLLLLLLLLLTIAIFFHYCESIRQEQCGNFFSVCVQLRSNATLWRGHCMYRGGLPCQSPRATQTLSEIA